MSSVLLFPSSIVRTCADCDGELPFTRLYLCPSCSHKRAAATPPRVVDQVRLVDGVLHIPEGAPERFRWWQGGQSLLATARELEAPPEVLSRYTLPEGRKIGE